MLLQQENIAQYGPVEVYKSLLSSFFVIAFVLQMQKAPKHKNGENCLAQLAAN